MKSVTKFNFLAIVALIVLGFVLGGCGSSTNLWGDPDSGLILTHRMAEGESIGYKLTTGFVQDMEMMGQKMQNTQDANYQFTIAEKGNDNGIILVGFTINDFALKLNTPQGEINVDPEPVKDKSFEMKVSPCGKESDITGLNDIKYSLGPGGERGIANDFQYFYSNLPKEPIVVGGSWTSYDTVVVNEANTNMNIYLESKNTLVGYETVMDMECAKIESDVKGTVKGSGSQMGADLIFSGTSEGKDTWYFAYKEGKLVKLVTDAKNDMKIDVQGPQEMTIPMVMTINNKLELIK